MNLRFGIGLLALTPTLKLAKFAQIAEQLEFDSIWLSDNYAIRNAFVGLTHMALATNSIDIGLGATNPYLVNPVVLASFFATLYETSSGRSVLGIGAGDINMLYDLHIKRDRPLATLREYIQILKELWTGKSLKNSGHIFQITKAALQFAIETPPPIYVAAQGPKMIQLAAEIANGVLLNAAHPLDYAVAKIQLDKGFTISGRKREYFDVTAYAVMSIEKLHTASRAKRKHVVAHIIAGTPELVLTRHNISLAQATKIRNLLYQSNWAEAAKAVTPEMLDVFAIVGTPEECISRIEQLIQTGVTHVVLAPSLRPSPRKVLEIIHEKIISVFLDST